MLPVQNLLSLCCLPKNLKIKVGGTTILSVILYFMSSSHKQNYQNQYNFTKVRFPFPIAIEFHPVYLSYRGFCLISWTMAMRANVVFSKSSLIFKGYGYKKMTRHIELLQRMPGCVLREYNTILFWSINTAVELLSSKCIAISGTIHTIYRNHSEFLFSLP
jgi:hypothetical protein